MLLKALYNKWHYIYSYDPLFFDILPEVKMDVPETLFKYYALCANSVDALTKSYIYVSHPDELNDVFDSSEYLMKFDNENVNKIMDRIISKVDYPNNNILTYSESHHEILHLTTGIFSLSEKCDSILLWAYYTNNKGFAIEFDIEKLKESTVNKTYGPFPINYIEKLEQISLNKYSMPCAFLMQSNIKDRQWEHEHEWRLIVESENGENFKHPTLKDEFSKERKVYYSSDSIKSIWLGKKFFQKDEFQSVDFELGVIYFELRSNIEHKSSILTFLSENNITTYCWCQNTLEMKPIECKIEKESSCKYRITILKIASN